MRVFQAAWIRWLGIASLLGSTLSSGAAAPQDSAARRQYAAASDLQSRGDYPHAAQAWEKFVADHKFDERIARAYHNLGVCHYQDGKYEQALAVFEKAAADYPQSDVAASTQLHLGATQVALAQAGQRPMVDRAVSTLLALLAKHPQGDHLADAYYYLGESLCAQGKRQEAVEWYARLVEKYPNHRLAAEARLSAGRCLYQAGKYAEAQEPLTKAIESGGARAAEATHWLAQSLLKQKQPQEALAVLGRIGPRAGDTPWAAQLLLDRADSVYAIPQRRKESIPRYAEVTAKYPKDAAAPQALYMAGYVALELADFPTALHHAARFQAAYPDHALVPDALYVAAESSLQLGKLPEADAFYSQLVEKCANHPDAALWRVRRAALLHAQKKHEEVIRVLEPVLGELRAPDSVAEARYLIGTSQSELKRPGEAIKSLTASLEAQPKWRRAFETRLALAAAYRDTGDLASAQAAVRRVIAEFPESPLLDRAYSRLGAYHALAGQPGQAAEVYRKVVAQWPTSPLAPYALHELGCAQLSLKDAAGAEATFNKLLEKQVQPTLASRARYARAMARQQQGKPVEAIADLEAALAAGPAAKDRSDVRFLLGLCQVESKQYDKAAATFRTLLSDDPKYAAADKAAFMEAECLFQQSTWAEALAAYARLKPAPEPQTRAAILLHAGQAAGKLQRWSESVEWLDRFVREFPDSPALSDALCELGWARQNLGKPTEAVAAYRQAIAKSDREAGARAQFLIGKIQAGQNDSKEAVKSFIKVVYGYSCPKWQADAAYEAARCLESLDQKPQAAAMYQELLDKFPKSDQVAAAKKRLAEIQAKK